MIRTLCLATIFILGAAVHTMAADRARVEAFLTTTGFDVAVGSIAQASGSAPAMLGLDTADFGEDWTRLSAEVFDPEAMTATAVDMLAQTLDDEMLIHAVDFYASDLGQRLVAAENAAHLTEDDVKQTEGAAIVANMPEARRALIARMNQAVDAGDMSIRAIEEIQVRFLSAASNAGVVRLGVDVSELRALIAEGRAELRERIDQSAVAAAAWTYRPFDDADLTAYAEALEHPTMQRIYELMNAVQYEIMADRFETLARRMVELHPGQDL